MSFKKDDRVKHRRTGRKGTVLGESESHPGWWKVQWDGESFWIRYEPEDLQALPCDDQACGC
jgi:hypothetical protein